MQAQKNVGASQLGDGHAVGEGDGLVTETGEERGESFGPIEGEFFFEAIVKSAFGSGLVSAVAGVDDDGGVRGGQTERRGEDGFE